MAFADAVEIHPDALVTVKLYVPAAKFDIVMVVPVPVTAPGLMVQVPVAGKPFKITLPVVIRQVGWVMVPIVGAPGVEGCELITTLAEAEEVHPEALVTVYVYVPVVKLDIVVDVPVPVIEPGLMVQVPDAGKPFNTTLPVATRQVGCVMMPRVGAFGVGG
jgi:hypothetical protein